MFSVDLLFCYCYICCNYLIIYLCVLQKFAGMGGDAMDDIDESDDEGMHSHFHFC